MVTDAKPRYVSILNELIKLDAKLHSPEQTTQQLQEAANWIFWGHLGDGTDTKLGKKFLESCKDINDRVIAAYVQDVLKGE